MRHFSDRPLAYVRLPARTPEAAARFAEDVFGLERADGAGFALRADERRQSLAFVGADETPAIGIEMADEAGLSGAVERLRAAGLPCEALDAQACALRRVRLGFVTRTPSGCAIELVARVEISARRFYSRRDSGVCGLSAVGVRSRDIARDLAFWTELVGAEISDHVGEIAYLRLDGQHHRIALYPSDGDGLLYVGFAVRAHDDLMRNAYFLQEQQVRIVHGPGCETASGRMFVRFQAPDGQVFALDFSDGEDIPGRRPRQFALDRYALCAWGSICLDIPELAAA
jgi:2,3-dihydroxy-p-cumate/2,3-dihydroxybenzoate 3,4-dioxygenase